MKMRKIRNILVILCICMMFLSACGSQSVQEAVVVKIAALKGPTTIGLLSLIEENKTKKEPVDYEFNMYVGADEILPLLIKGEVDIALLPANVASVLYQKMEGKLSVIDINTLGVLYMISGDDRITSMKDLIGKTIYLTGKGATPEYVLGYLFEANGIDVSQVNLEFCSEATEVAALLAANPEGVGLLPQPFVTVACNQNESLAVVLDMTEEWNKVQETDESSLITGVTVVRREFLEENEKVVQMFLKEHEESTQKMNSDLELAARLVVETEIISNEAVAKKAIPFCNVTYIDGIEMKQALSGYLEALFQQNPESIGNNLPKEDFYYIP